MTHAESRKAKPDGTQPEDRRTVGLNPTAPARRKYGGVIWPVPPDQVPTREQINRMADMIDTEETDAEGNSRSPG